jgi:hypothetical protein
VAASKSIAEGLTLQFKNSARVTVRSSVQETSNRGADSSNTNGHDFNIFAAKREPVWYDIELPQ